MFLPLQKPSNPGVFTSSVPQSHGKGSLSTGILINPDIYLPLPSKRTSVRCDSGLGKGNEKCREKTGSEAENEETSSKLRDKNEFLQLPAQIPIPF